MIRELGESVKPAAAAVQEDIKNKARRWCVVSESRDVTEWMKLLYSTYLTLSGCCGSKYRSGYIPVQSKSFAGV